MEKITMNNKIIEITIMFQELALHIMKQEENRKEAVPRLLLNTLLAMITKELKGEDPIKSVESFENASNEEKQELFETSLALIGVACTQIDALVSTFVEDDKAIKEPQMEKGINIKDMLDQEGLSLN